jgi:hypothetical protein
LPASTRKARSSRQRRSICRLDPAFVQLNEGVLPPRASSEAERFWRVRRGEEYATLGAAAVTELYSESRSGRPSARVWAITRRAQRDQTLTSQRETRQQRRHAERSQRDHPGHHRRWPQERQVGADAC